MEIAEPNLGCPSVFRAINRTMVRARHVVHRVGSRYGIHPRPLVSEFRLGARVWLFYLSDKYYTGLCAVC